jgi:hypothetical protein
MKKRNNSKPVRSTHLTTALASTKHLAVDVLQDDVAGMWLDFYAFRRTMIRMASAYLLASEQGIPFAEACHKVVLDEKTRLVALLNHQLNALKRIKSTPASILAERRKRVVMAEQAVKRIQRQRPGVLMAKLRKELAAASNEDLLQLTTDFVDTPAQFAGKARRMKIKKIIKRIECH